MWYSLHYTYIDDCSRHIILYIHNKLTDTRGHPGYRYHVQRRSGRVVISLSGARVRAVFYSNGLVIRQFDSGLNVVSSTRLIFLLCYFFSFHFCVKCDTNTAFTSNVSKVIFLSKVFSKAVSSMHIIMYTAYIGVLYLGNNYTFG